MEMKLVVLELNLKELSSIKELNSRRGLCWLMKLKCLSSPKLI